MELRWRWWSRVGGPLVGAAVIAATAAQAADVKAIRNLGKPERIEPGPVALEVRQQHLDLAGMQIGDVPAGSTDYDLATFEGVATPCRSPHLDGLGAGFALVCPDEAGVEHALFAQQGTVLRISRPVVRRSRISLSDDGVRLAAVLQGEAGAAIHVYDVLELLDMALVGLEEPRDPVLAGSGSAVACTAVVGKRRHVVVVDLASGDARVVSDGLDDVKVGAISANGRRVAFKASHGGWDDYYLADLDRKLRYNLSDSEGDTVAIDLSQDGDTVAFVQRFGGAMGIFTADISARKVANRSGVLGSVVDVIVSASGTRHAFLLGGLSPKIEVWDTKGRTEVQVATVAEGCWEPAMSSDGRFVAALCADGARDAALLRLFPLPEPE